MKVLVTGGAGYVGSVLVPQLLADRHQVLVYDTYWFAQNGRWSPQGWVGDVRDTKLLTEAMLGIDVVIHLACISNDPSVELDESLSRTINYECFEPMVIAAKRMGVKRFIYASTSSVYGVSDAPDVTEEHPLVPITLYNTYKAKCEPLLFKHQSDDFVCVTVRPSTICGYSPRQRLDLAVNILTNLAVNKGKITVHGGKQRRPNLHIQDMVDCYRLLLTARPEKIQGQTFNVGAANMTIDELAVIVQKIIPVPIEHTGSVDVRSYQVCSDKIRDVLGFVPDYTVDNAVLQLLNAFRDGRIPNPLDDDNYYNVRRMRKIWESVYKNAPPSKFDPTSGHLSEIDVMHR